MKIRSDTVVSFCALALSLCGVTASIIQTRVMVQQQQALVWPHLQLGTGNVGEFFVDVQNVGNGPAQIKSVRVTWNGKNFDNFGPMLREIRQAKMSGKVDLNMVESFLENRTMRAGESVRTAAFKGESGQQLFRAFETEEWSYDIVYASLYGRCWSFKDGETTELEACPVRK